MPLSVLDIEKVYTWRGTMPVQFLYTAGVAGERFFRTLRRRGKFAITRCAECDITYLPPRLYCERCFVDLSDTWAEVAPTGRVHTFTVVHLDREGRRLATPEIIGFVRINGTNGGLVSRLLDVRPEEVHLDMAVQAVLAPPRQRRGTLEDVRGFAPPAAASPTSTRRRSRGSGRSR